ncbi:MAG: hypothetical protein B6U76_00955 [Desulfurococcales archaeon ex4484_217_2]|nr:MAG: hypothetical protein B6U76_00955 [Desulfurococcales archaeon ex4484_217_2]
MVEDLVKRLDSVVTDMIWWLRDRASEFKAQRKYKIANKLSGLAAELGDAFRPLKHYSTEEVAEGLLLKAYGEFYRVCTSILFEVGDIDVDKTNEFHSKATDLATEIVLITLRGD